MSERSIHRDLGEAVGEGWVATGGFFGSWMSGFLLGYLADRWLGTEPWLVVTGSVAGAVLGFYQMLIYAKERMRS